MNTSKKVEIVGTVLFSLIIFVFGVVKFFPRIASGETWLCVVIIGFSLSFGLLVYFVRKYLYYRKTRQK